VNERNDIMTVSFHYDSLEDLAAEYEKHAAELREKAAKAALLQRVEARAWENAAYQLRNTWLGTSLRTAISAMDIRNLNGRLGLVVRGQADAR
jgi:hypothetical protein